MLEKAIAEEGNTNSEENRGETSKNKRNVVQVVEDGAEGNSQKKSSCC